MNNRIHHLDNLRAAMVLAVVVLHSLMAYAPWATWWYALDPDPLPGAALATFLLDSFPMPVLFFLAGFFAAPSRDAKGRGGFVLSKLRRLGLPWLACAVLILPIIPWIALTTRDLLTVSPPHFWTRYLASALEPQAMLITTTPDYAELAFLFSQFHLWFISLLLCFFLAYALAPGCVGTSGVRRPSLSLAIGGLLMTVAMAGICQIMPEWSWLNLGWLLLQPVRLPMYLGFFGLGVIAFRRGWLDSGRLPGPVWAWILATAGMLAPFYLVSPLLLTRLEPLSFPLALLQMAIRVFACLAWLGLFLALFRRLANRSGPVAKSLAASSYAIYLLHLPVCVAAQWFFAGTGLPVAVKFLLVLAVSALLPWLAAAGFQRVARRTRSARARSGART